MSTDRDTSPMQFDARQNRAERAAVRLVESAGWKISTNIVVTALLAVCAWSFQSLAGKVDKIADTLSTYAIASATNELRMQRIESDNGRQDAENVRQNADIRALQDKQAAITFKLDSLRTPERAR